jgi:polyhydroxyalkanoate synthesis repressor PhaR
MILIKRYLNRKLYDTKNSKYVTITDIIGLIQNNEEVKVIENNTQEDITNVIMAQVLLKIEQKENTKKDSSSKKGIKALIQNSGDSLGSYIHKTKDTIKNEVDKIIKKGETELNDLVKQFQQFYDSSTSIIENIPKRIDEKVKESINTLFPIQRIKEFDNLLKKVDYLEERIETLESKLLNKEEGENKKHI